MLGGTNVPVSFLGYWLVIVFTVFSGGCTELKAKYYLHKLF